MRFFSVTFDGRRAQRKEELQKLKQQREQRQLNRRLENQKFAILRGTRLVKLDNES
jgi:hypothetical protein